MDIGATALAAGSGLGAATEWREALDHALDAALAPLHGQSPDLLLIFANAAFAPSYSAILGVAAERSRTRELVGCSASGVIANARELEDEPAIAALALRLPGGAALRSSYLAPPDPTETPERVDWAQRLDLAAADCTGLIVLADPFSMDVGQLVAELERAYPRVPLVGGLATGAAGVRVTHVFHGRQARAGGAVVIGLAGTAVLRTVVSQGCEPIGAVWTVTDAEGYLVKTIGNRPAYDVLVETIQALDPHERTRAARNLLVGLAMDEYRDEFKRGDFLIRNVMGVDRSSGAIAIGAEPRVGQTLQFQIRDARAADEELRQMLQSEATHSAPGAALLFACNGRGSGLFGAPDHDARTVHEVLGALPLAGLFCNGEIGPVGKATYIHGFTASLGLVTTS